MIYNINTESQSIIEMINDVTGKTQKQEELKILYKIISENIMFEILSYIILFIIYKYLSRKNLKVGKISFKTFNILFILTSVIATIISYIVVFYTT